MTFCSACSKPAFTQHCRRAADLIVHDCRWTLSLRISACRESKDSLLTCEETQSSCNGGRPWNSTSRPFGCFSTSSRNRFHLCNGIAVRLPIMTTRQQAILRQFPDVSSEWQMGTRPSGRLRCPPFDNLRDA